MTSLSCRGSVREYVFVFYRHKKAIYIYFLNRHAKKRSKRLAKVESPVFRNEFATSQSLVDGREPASRGPWALIFNCRHSVYIIVWFCELVHDCLSPTRVHACTSHAASLPFNFSTQLVSRNGFAAYVLCCFSIGNVPYISVHLLSAVHYFRHNCFERLKRLYLWGRNAFLTFYFASNVRNKYVSWAFCLAFPCQKYWLKINKFILKSGTQTWVKKKGETASPKTL